MDDIDRQLLGLLREDGRASIAALAKRLKVARGTVQNRLAKLEANGTILGYTVRLRPQAEDRVVRGIMTVELEGRRQDAVMRALRGEPAVVGMHTTNGRWDLVVELRADTLHELDKVLVRIGAIDGVSRCETNLLLTTHKV
jgi:DNA-binding Lrp family transcriptional regulator